MTSKTSKRDTGRVAATEVKALKAYHTMKPFPIIIAVAELALFVRVAQITTGWTRTALIIVIALQVTALLLGPKARRKQLRRFLVADRAVTRIRAMKDRQPNADDVFEVTPGTDRVSFWVGYGFAMQQVDTQIDRAGDDVDTA